MEINIPKSHTTDIKYILVSAGVRHWDDSTVNGAYDSEKGINIPCRSELPIGDGYRWEPLINIETGIIENWEKGKTASVHYKVCDDGTYTLLDSDKQEVLMLESYVPDILAIDDSGFGDYIILDIDENGAIRNWKCTEEDINDMINDSFN